MASKEKAIVVVLNTLINKIIKVLEFAWGDIETYDSLLSFKVDTLVRLQLEACNVKRLGQVFW